MPAIAENPVLAGWTGPHGGGPVFAGIEPPDFAPALDEAMARYRAENNMGGAVTGALGEQQLSELNAKLVAARAESAEKKAKYDQAQREAERAGREMWAGSYVEPWLYRVCIRANGIPVLRRCERSPLVATARSYPCARMSRAVAILSNATFVRRVSTTCCSYSSIIVTPDAVRGRLSVSTRSTYQ